jgi:hypothetical protein
MQKEHAKKFTVVISMITLSLVMTTVVIANTNQPQNTVQERFLLPAAGSNLDSSARPVLPQSFSITVNGHEDADVVTTVKRGQTIQLGSLVTPMINGVVGDVEITSSLPVCGTVDISLGCTPSGITVSLPTNQRVLSAANLPLTVSVSDSVPPGIYWYSLSVTPLRDQKNVPPSAGYIAAFGIEVQ